MEILMCIKCGESAYTFEEIISGTCGTCGGDLVQEDDSGETAAGLGLDSEL